MCLLAALLACTPDDVAANPPRRGGLAGVAPTRGTVGLPLPVGVSEAGLGAAEAIVGRFPTLRAFLASESALNDYYRALAHYYGANQFERQSFDAIIAQLRQATAAVPELENRLWDATGTVGEYGEGFRIHAPRTDTNHHLRREQWVRHMARWHLALEQTAAPLMVLSSDDSKEERVALIQHILDRLNEVDRVFAETEGLPRVQRNRRRGEAMASLRDAEFTHKYNALIAHLTRRHLDVEQVAGLLRGDNAHAVLQGISDLSIRDADGAVPWLRQALTELGLPSTTPIPSRLHGDLAASLPRPEALLADREFFIHKADHSESWDFVPLKRRLHGIFAGIPLRDCTGGACEHLKHLTPERWAVIALKNAEQFHIMEEGRFRGFLQYVPVVTTEARGRTHHDVSVDYESSALSVPVRYTDRRGVERTGPLFDVWLPEATRRLAPHAATTVRRFLSSARSHINEAGALPTVQSAASYILGAPRGDRHGTAIEDPLAGELVGLGESMIGRDRKYGGAMVTEGTLRTTGAIHGVEAALALPSLVTGHTSTLVSRDAAVFRGLLSSDIEVQMDAGWKLHELARSTSRPVLTDGQAIASARSLLFRVGGSLEAELMNVLLGSGMSMEEYVRLATQASTASDVSVRTNGILALDRVAGASGPGAVNCVGGPETYRSVLQKLQRDGN